MYIYKEMLHIYVLDLLILSDNDSKFVDRDKDKTIIFSRLIYLTAYQPDNGYFYQVVRELRSL